MKTKIYVLKCPDTKEVRYVGKSNNPEQRLKAHNNKARDIGTYKRNWINKLRVDGKKPIFEIIEEVDIAIWKEKEKYWINYYLAQGAKLVNSLNDIGKGLTSSNNTSFKKGNGAKTIILLDNNGDYIGSFLTQEEASIFIGKKGIGSALIKQTKTCGGYICLYEEEYDNLSQDDINMLVEYSKDFSTKGGKETRFLKGTIAWNKGLKGIKLKPDKNVHQYCAYTGDFIKSYNTAKIAGDTLNISIEGIGRCCRNTAKSAGGFIWRYDKKEQVEIRDNVKLKIKKI